MKLSFGFGTGVQEVEVPEKNLMAVLRANEVDAPASEPEEVLRALREPIGSAPLKELVRPGMKVAIVTSDITRPMPTYKVLPAVLDELYAGGVRKEDITLVFALGSHRSHTPEEQKKLAGSGHWRKSPAWIPILPIASIWAAPPPARRWILPVWWRRLILESVLEISSTTILPGTPAVPRRLCPVFLPGMPFRPIIP